MVNITVKKLIGMTKNDAARLKEKAKEAGMNETEYIRFLIWQQPNDYPEIRILLGRLINEINHIGVNINQIVKRHNSGEYQEGDKVRLEAYLRKINDTLQEAVVDLGNK